MKTIVTKGLVLARINYQEADRIVTLLTPDHGKIRVMAKGVRKPKSKLAGGIELLTVAQITYLPGRGELGTLISARAETHYGTIVKDIDRTMYAYEFLKLVNKITEDVVEADYFELIEATLTGLNRPDIALETTQLWSGLQLLQLTGHAPNLHTDINGRKLEAAETYLFSFDDMTFAPTPQGESIVAVAKVLRLASSEAPLPVFATVRGIQTAIPAALQMVKTMQQYSLHP